jgi:integral membrane protein
MKNTLKQFQKIAILEGWSYLILLGIGMPLKYILHIAMPLKIIGWAHGVLFIIYCVLLLILLIKKWPFKYCVIAFIASLIPFGTFVLDKKLLQKEMH